MLKNNKVIFVLFLLIFLGFFLQYPLKSSLTGDIDAIGNLAMYKQMQLAIEGWFGSAPAGSLCYPVDRVWVYFGSDFGIGIIHVVLNLLGISDLWAHYLFISLLFALNSFTLYLLLHRLFGDRLAALFGGLIFSLAQFTLGNLENPNTLVFFPSFLSLYYYFLSLEDSKRSTRYFIFAAVIGVVLIYLSPYNFLYHCIIWAVIILAIEAPNLNRITVRKYGLTAIAYIIILIPFIRFYLFHDDLDIDYDYIMTPEIASRLGLSATDFLQSLPNHLYMGDKYVEYNSWTGRIQSAYLGIAFYLLAVIGLVRAKMRRISIVLIVIGLIMGIGPFIVLGPDRTIPNLTWPLYEYLNFGNVFRITCRGFFLSLFGLTILATSGFIALRKARMFIPLLLLPCLLVAENISWPMYTYEQEHILNPDPEMITYLKNDEELAVVLSLPSQLFDYEGSHREYVYMYWQYFHRQNTVNGSLGFFPKERTAVNDLLKDFDREALLTVMSSRDVDHVVFHRDLATKDSDQILSRLLSYDYLEQRLSTERTVIFDFVPIDQSIKTDMTRDTSSSFISP